VRHLRFKTPSPLPPRADSPRAPEAVPSPR
jgi:hypothetical protein